MRGREVGRWLRQAQRAAGLSGVQLGDRLGWSPTMLSRTMTGARLPTEVELVALLVACGVSSPEARDELVRLVQPYQDNGLHLPPERVWRVFLEHAVQAYRLVEFAPFVLPWMLHTPAYADALVATADGERDPQLVPRGTARHLLGCPRVELLVHEWALRTPVLDAVGMSEVLHHLLRVSVRESVSVRVVPIGAAVQASRYGGFTVMEIAECAPVLYREDHASGVFLDHDPAVVVYQSIADRLRAAALDEQHSRYLIAQITTELYGDVSESVDEEGKRPADSRTP